VASPPSSPESSNAPSLAIAPLLTASFGRPAELGPISPPRTAAPAKPVASPASRPAEAVWESLGQWFVASPTSLDMALQQPGDCVVFDTGAAQGEFGAAATTSATNSGGAATTSDPAHPAAARRRGMGHSGVSAVLWAAPSPSSSIKRAAASGIGSAVRSGGAASGAPARRWPAASPPSAAPSSHAAAGLSSSSRAANPRSSAVALNPASATPQVVQSPTDSAIRHWLWDEEEQERGRAATQQRVQAAAAGGSLARRGRAGALPTQVKQPAICATPQGSATRSGGRGARGRGRDLAPSPMTPAAAGSGTPAGPTAVVEPAAAASEPILAAQATGTPGEAYFTPCGWGFTPGGGGGLGATPYFTPCSQGDGLEGATPESSSSKGGGEGLGGMGGGRLLPRLPLTFGHACACLSPRVACTHMSPYVCSCSRKRALYLFLPRSLSAPTLTYCHFPHPHRHPSCPLAPGQPRTGPKGSPVPGSAPSQGARKGQASRPSAEGATPKQRLTRLFRAAAADSAPPASPALSPLTRPGAAAHGHVQGARAAMVAPVLPASAAARRWSAPAAPEPVAPAPAAPAAPPVPRTAERVRQARQAAVARRNSAAFEAHISRRRRSLPPCDAPGAPQHTARGPGAPLARGAPASPHTKAAAKASGGCSLPARGGAAGARLAGSQPSSCSLVTTAGLEEGEGAAAVAALDRCGSAQSAREEVRGVGLRGLRLEGRLGPPRDALLLH
jgi:hypothetical protein